MCVTIDLFNVSKLLYEQLRKYGCVEEWHVAGNACFESCVSNFFSGLVRCKVGIGMVMAGELIYCD